MASETIATLAKMLESLPQAAQDQVVAHLRECIADIRDAIRWDLSFERTRERLAEAGRRAKQEIAAGLAKPMNLDLL